MFDTKSRARLEVEKYVLQSMTFHFDGKCAVLCLPASLVEELSVEEGDLDGIASMSRQVEGVMVGVTIREKEDGMLKVSLRTNPPVNAAEILFFVKLAADVNLISIVAENMQNTVIVRLIP